MLQFRFPKWLECSS